MPNSTEYHQALNEIKDTPQFKNLTNKLGDENIEQALKTCILSAPCFEPYPNIAIDKRIIDEILNIVLPQEIPLEYYLGYKNILNSHRSWEESLISNSVRYTDNKLNDIGKKLLWLCQLSQTSPYRHIHYDIHNLCDYFFDYCNTRTNKTTNLPYDHHKLVQIIKETDTNILWKLIFASNRKHKWVDSLAQLINEVEDSSRLKEIISQIKSIDNFSGIIWRIRQTWNLSKFTTLVNKTDDKDIPKIITLIDQTNYDAYESDKWLVCFLKEINIKSLPQLTRLITQLNNVNVSNMLYITEILNRQQDISWLSLLINKLDDQSKIEKLNNDWMDYHRNDNNLYTLLGAHIEKFITFINQIHPNTINTFWRCNLVNLFNWIDKFNSTQLADFINSSTTRNRQSIVESFVKINPEIIQELNIINDIIEFNKNDEYNFVGKHALIVNLNTLFSIGKTSIPNLKILLNEIDKNKFLNIIASFDEEHSIPWFGPIRCLVTWITNGDIFAISDIFNKQNNAREIAKSISELYGQTPQSYHDLSGYSGFLDGGSFFIGG